MYSGLLERMMSTFWKMASAVPRYQCSSPERCWAGSRSIISLSSACRKLQPRCMCRSSECDLYWVTTAMRRMPEFRQLDKAKSMMRNLPPKYTAGLARFSVSCFRREPRPAGQHQGHGLSHQLVGLDVFRRCHFRAALGSCGRAVFHARLRWFLLAMLGHLT